MPKTIVLLGPNTETLRTTESMKRKANVISRCMINIFKIFRMCKKTPKNRN